MSEDLLPMMDDDPLGLNFLENVPIGAKLRHKPSGLTGSCVSKGRTVIVNGRVTNLANFVTATLEFPSGSRISFTHPFLELVKEETPADG